MNDSPPSAGERAAIAGYSAQYGIAAEIVRRHLRDLQWIRLADPTAGVADDFQFGTSNARHAIQVKWALYPDSFSWSDLFGTPNSETSLFGDLATAWRRLRDETDGVLRIHLCSNRYASSATPQAGSPLQQVTATGPHHLAAFLARSFQPVQHLIACGLDDWSTIEDHDLVREWRSAWDRVQAASGLSDVDFVAYLAAIEVRLGISAPLELLADSEQSSDQHHIAQTIQRLVSDARHIVHLTRDELLTELGWWNRLAYRHPHRFPVPEVYTPNAAAVASLSEALKDHESGYLALVGAAGTGKSTLLESFRADAAVVRYYAFVPDSTGPISARGEAQAFLHDLNLALQDTGLYSRHFGADLTGQRSILASLLEDAHRRYEREGRPTIVIVDGLDHISREQSPTRSLIDELPAPELLQSGVYFALGSQSVAMLPSNIRDTLAESRHIELPALARAEVDSIIDKSGVGAWITESVREALHNESEGHPLALTYLLQDLADVESSVGNASDRNLEATSRLRELTAFRGDVLRRYNGYLESVGGDAALMELLAVVSRVRAPVRIDWLASWTSAELAEKFTSRTYPFFARAGDEWHFIHNSFRLFLIERTSAVAGVFSGERDRSQYARTADICATSSSVVYRDEELSHRYLAGQLHRVVELATPAALRSRLVQLRPTRVVRSHANIALRAASELGDLAAMVPLFLFAAELVQRDYILNPSTLAEAAVEVLPPGEVREHLLQSGRLVVEDAAAFRAAAHLASAGSYLLADELLRAADDPRSSLGRRSRSEGSRTDTITAWTRAHYLLGGFDRVLAALDAVEGPRHVDLDDQDHEDAIDSARVIRQRALACCSELAAEVRDNEALERISAEVSAIGDPNWIARMHVVRARTAAEDGLLGEVAQHAQSVVSLDRRSVQPPPDPNLGEDSHAARGSHLIVEALRHAMLETLLRSGLGDLSEASILAERPLMRRWPDTSLSGQGLAPFLPYLATTRLELVLPHHDAVAATPTHSDLDPRHAGRRRFEEALRVLAQIETLAWPSPTVEPGTTPPISSLADPIVRLLEVPSRQTHDWSSWYSFRDAAPELWERLLASALASPYDTVESVIRLFQDAWSSSTRRVYWHPSLRTGIVKWVAEHVPGLTDLTQEILTSIDTEIDGAAWDVHDRVDTWLTQSRSWAAAGFENRARVALQSAVEQGWGPSQNDENEQLAHYAEWLELAFESGAIGVNPFVEDILDFASRVERASADASSQAKAAAEAITIAAFRASPALACQLATFFCDLGVFEESAAIGSIVRGLVASTDGAEVGLSIYCHMLAPTSQYIAPAVRADVTRAASQSASKATLAWAESLRIGSENGAGTSETDAEQPPGSDEPQAVPPPIPGSPSALLRQMREADAADVSGATLAAWEAALAESTHLPSRPVAEALVDEGRRMGLTGPFMGTVIAICAAAGGGKKATDALSEALTRLPITGWWRRYDGGTRLALVKAALGGNDPELQRISLNDFAGAITSGALSADIPIHDLLHILGVLVGDRAVGDAWVSARPSLDIFAPSATRPASLTAPTDAISPAEAGAKWVSGFVGHPTRAIDFGARNVLEALINARSASAELATVDLLASGGWLAEGALAILLRAAAHGHRLSDAALGEIAVAARNDDLIVRALAQEVLVTSGVDPPTLPVRELPPAIRLSFPPLSGYKSYLVDAEGVPVVDMTNPLEVVAPYEDLLLKIADVSGLDESAVLHYASEIARTQTDLWLAGGHRAQAERLKRRGQKLIYRPWALMVGRRAVGHVAALLHDSGNLRSAGNLAVEMGLLDSIDSPTPRPLNASTPLPWRDESVRGYDTRTWTEEATAAAEAYASAHRDAETFVLAEVGEWKSLAWNTPSERRTLVPVVGLRSKGLRLIRTASVTSLDLESRAYEEFDSGDKTLVVRSEEFLSDPERPQWIAINPSFARRLGWRPSMDVPFEWLGEDGTWRARTVFRVRGDLGFAPPEDDYAGSVWQVELSEAGERDLRSVEPTFSRLLRVKRRVKRDDGEDSATAQVELPETGPIR